jgi:hypothetical protein
LIVGTKGRNLNGIQGLLPGSVSKYCLQNSPIPVIVVRPNNMRARGKRKRQNDPSRQVYRDLLDKSDKLPHGADVFVKLGVALDAGQAMSADEATAVAQAIGVGGKPHKPLHLPSRGSPGPKSPLIKVQSVDDADVTLLTDLEPERLSPTERPAIIRKASDPPSPNSPLASVKELPEVPEHPMARKPVVGNGLSPT